MALTNSQYDALMRQYNDKQYRNNTIREERKREVYKKAPEMTMLDARISRIAIDNFDAYTSDDPSIMENLKKQLEEIKTERIALLKSIGLPADYLDSPCDCKDCQDTGFIGDIRCHCFKQAAIDLVYTQSNIKDILTRENFSTFDINVYSDIIPSGEEDSPRDIARNALHRAHEFCDSFPCGEGFLIMGRTGCGKTFLSNCIAKELLDRGSSVVYFTSYELFSVFEKQTFEKDPDFADEHDHIFNCDLLIIDDLGTELVNNFTVSKLFTCLNERMLNGKSTIISTNLSLREIADRYSERITSRILSSYKVINLIGDDIRLNNI